MNLYALIDPLHPDATRYIGKTKKPISTRLAEHIADAKRGLKNYRCTWIRSVLAEGRRPVAVLLQIVDGAGGSEEQGLIAAYRGVRARLTNGTDGGEGWETMSPEVVQKILASRAWYSHPPAVREKISSSKKGKPIHPNTVAAVKARAASPGNVERMRELGRSKAGTQATAGLKEKLSAAQKASWANGRRTVAPESIEAVVASAKARAGKPLSDETKAKISKVHLGRKRSDETRRRLSEAIKRHWETKRRP